MTPVGKISKLFGAAGEVVINLYDSFPDEFNTKEPLLVIIDSLTVPLFFDKFERRGPASALAKFADMDTPDRVRELMGLELLTHGKPDSGEEISDRELYMEDLVGFAARFVGNDLEGEIQDFIDHELNPLFSVSAGDREVLIPAADRMIDSIDLDRRTVTFDLPEGLLDLYLL